MKRFLSVIVTFSCIHLSIGQITILRNDLPKLNDTVRITNTSINNIDYKSTGENYSWDFSNLSNNGESVMEYKAALQTDYWLAFLNLNYYGLKTEDITIGGYGLKDIYQFYEIDNSKYGIKGIGVKFQDVPLAAVYNKMDKIFSLPLKNGQRDSNQYSFKVDIPSLGSYKGSGYRITEVDGWGTITTPFGTFECLRTKSASKGIDSITANILGFPISFGLPVNKIEYQWWGKNQKSPILSIEGRIVAGSFVPITTYYRGTEISIPTSLENQQIANNWKVLPLIGKGLKIEVPFELLNSEVNIYQLDGKLVHSLKIKNSITEVYLNHPSGVYICIMNSGNNMTTKKIILP
jgi:hypothetical protein